MERRLHEIEIESERLKEEYNDLKTRLERHNRENLKCWAPKLRRAPTDILVKISQGLRDHDLILYGYFVPEFFDAIRYLPYRGPFPSTLILNSGAKMLFRGNETYTYLAYLEGFIDTSALVLNSNAGGPTVQGKSALFWHVDKFERRVREALHGIDLQFRRPTLSMKLMRPLFDKRPISSNLCWDVKNDLEAFYEIEFVRLWWSHFARIHGVDVDWSYLRWYDYKLVTTLQDSGRFKEVTEKYQDEIAGILKRYVKPCGYIHWRFLEQ